jgi:hypothetical protein
MSRPGSVPETKYLRLAYWSPALMVAAISVRLVNHLTLEMIVTFNIPRWDSVFVF